MNEQQFLDQINAIHWEQPAGNEDYRNTLLVLADWLEERGDPRGELIRLREGLLGAHTPAERKLWEPRMQALIHAGVKPIVATWQNGLGMKFCWCPAGQFMMGSPENEQSRVEDEQQVSVTLTQGFWLGKYPVTQWEWDHVMGTTPWIEQEYVQEGSENPAVYLSWDDAQEYLPRLADSGRLAGQVPSGWEYRLPTEAQWEYACRAGTSTAFYFGNDVSLLDEYGWHFDNAWTSGEQFPHPVGQKLGNAWGVHDLHGNVWEWCQDWSGEQPLGGINPTGPTEGELRILRGGSWSDDGQYCRSAFRYVDEPDYNLNNYGLRLVLVPASK